MLHSLFAALEAVGHLTAFTRWCSMPNPQQYSDTGSDSSYTSQSSHENASDDSAGGDQEDEEDVVNVDLEFYDPSEIDFHGLKALLRSLLDGDDFHGCSDLVEAIIRQVPVLSGTAK